MAIMNSLSQHEEQLRETLVQLEQDPSDEHADSNIEALLAKIGGCEDVASKLERSLDDLIAGLDDVLAGLRPGPTSTFGEAQSRQVDVGEELPAPEAPEATEAEAAVVPPQTKVERLSDNVEPCAQVPDLRESENAEQLLVHSSEETTSESTAEHGHESRVAHSPETSSVKSSG